MLEGRWEIATLLRSAIPLMSVADPNGMSTFLAAVALFADALDIQFHEPIFSEMCSAIGLAETDADIIFFQTV